MKFFNTSQIRELDQYTIEHEPISSIDLMERAARALCEKYLSAFSGQNTVCVLAGPGNNGGDALALARLLLIAGLDVKVVLLHLGKLSDDCETNKQRLLQKFPDCFHRDVGHPRERMGAERSDDEAWVLCQSDV